MLVDLVLEGLVTLLSLSIVVIEYVVGSAATEPVAATIQIGTLLLVPVAEVIGVTPFVSHTTAGQTPAHANHLCLTELLKIELTGTFSHDITDIDGGVHLLSICTPTNGIHVFCGTCCVLLIETCFCTEQVSLSQTEQVHIAIGALT